jgi:hypothetical protein
MSFGIFLYHIYEENEKRKINGINRLKLFQWNYGSCPSMQKKGSDRKLFKDNLFQGFTNDDVK